MRTNSHIAISASFQSSHKSPSKISWSLYEIFWSLRCPITDLTSTPRLSCASPRPEASLEEYTLTNMSNHDICMGQICWAPYILYGNKEPTFFFRTFTDKSLLSFTNFIPLCTLYMHLLVSVCLLTILLNMQPYIFLLEEISTSPFDEHEKYWQIFQVYHHCIRIIPHTISYHLCVGI